MKMENKLAKAKRKLEEIGCFSCPQNPDSSPSKITVSDSQEVLYVLFSHTPILRGCTLAAKRSSPG